MPAGEVITSYHELWQVEQSFRMSKSDLRARPIFARTRHAIEAHLTNVFTALAISREAQNRTGLSIRRVLRTLKPLRSATLEINGITSGRPGGRRPSPAVRDQDTGDQACRKRSWHSPPQPCGIRDGAWSRTRVAEQARRCRQ